MAYVRASYVKRKSRRDHIRRRVKFMGSGGAQFDVRRRISTRLLVSVFYFAKASLSGGLST
jgi:hypothetical protein